MCVCVYECFTYCLFLMLACSLLPHTSSWCHQSSWMASWQSLDFHFIQICNPEVASSGIDNGLKFRFQSVPGLKQGFRACLHSLGCWFGQHRNPEIAQRQTLVAHGREECKVRASMTWYPTLTQDSLRLARPDIWISSVQATLSSLGDGQDKNLKHDLMNEVWCTTNCDIEPFNDHQYHKAKQELF